MGRKAIVDSAVKVAVMAALREGRRLEEVAEAVGVTVQAFYSARRRDPLFAAGWSDAHSAGAAAERARDRAARPPWEWEEGVDGADGGEPGEHRIQSNNKRCFQRRRMRHVRFDEGRQQLFLAHFSWSGDVLAAAAEAGTSERTVYAHRRRDPHFAALFQEALDQCYVRLEAEAVRQRLAAQARIRRAMEEAEPAAASDGARDDRLAGDMAAEFDRVMKLLARWDRRGGAVGPRTVGVEHQRVWTFDESIVALEKRLTALGFIKEGEGPE